MSTNGSIPSSNGQSQKRKLEEESSKPLSCSVNKLDTTSSKRVVQDGFSWHSTDNSCWFSGNLTLSPMTELPKKPERPLDSDCCGQGCDPCVLDLYAEDLKIWEEECFTICNGEKRKVIDRKVVDVTGPILSQTEYRTFIVESVTQETHNCYRFRFVLPIGKTLGLQAGQHIVIRGEVDGEVITRQYTPVTHVDTKSTFDLIIKLYDEGRMSRYVRDWSNGTEVAIRGPCGSFVYEPNKYKRVIMLAVGTGIAPMAQVIQTVLNNEDDMTRIELLYGCKTYTDILLKSELDDWSGYWNFTSTYYMSQKSGSGSKYRYGDKVVNGRISNDIVQTVIDSSCDNILVLICGTRSFEQDMILSMKNIGLTEDRYHKF